MTSIIYNQWYCKVDPKVEIGWYVIQKVLTCYDFERGGNTIVDLWGPMRMKEFVKARANFYFGIIVYSGYLISKVYKSKMMQISNN